MGRKVLSSEEFKNKYNKFIYPTDNFYFKAVLLLLEHNCKVQTSLIKTNSITLLLIHITLITYCHIKQSRKPSS